MKLSYYLWKCFGVGVIYTSTYGSKSTCMISAAAYVGIQIPSKWFVHGYRMSPKQPIYDKITNQIKLLTKSIKNSYIIENLWYDKKSLIFCISNKCIVFAGTYTTYAIFLRIQILYRCIMLYAKIKEGLFVSQMERSKVLPNIIFS